MINDDTTNSNLYTEIRAIKATCVKITRYSEEYIGTEGSPPLTHFEKCKIQIGTRHHEVENTRKEF